MHLYIIFYIMLNTIIKRPSINTLTAIIIQNFAVEKRLFIYDGSSQKPQEFSGIRATIFGATGLTGKYIGGLLGQIGSELIFPYTTDYKHHHSDDIKELRLSARTSKCYLHKDMNFKDQNMIERMIGNSNVVINLVGPRKHTKKRQDFQFVNIETAERIATACKKKGIHRLIHFSAAGANQESPCQDFQTKAIAEKRVLEIFPNATIFRPCPIYGMNDYFATLIQRQSDFFLNKFTVVSDDCTAKKQPIYVSDIAQCVLNALKLEQTKGRIYELGGPHVFSYLEVYEIIYNYLKVYPKLAYINPDLLKWIASKIYNWQFLSIDMIIRRTLDQVVKKSDKVGTIEDLYVQPVSFKNGIQTMFSQKVAFFGQNQQENSI